MSGDLMDLMDSTGLGAQQDRDSGAKRVHKNKRQKLTHENARIAEESATALSISTEKVESKQPPRNSDRRVKVLGRGDAVQSPGGRTWAISDAIGGRYIDADPLMTQNEE
jgi:hypothetical protein